MIDIVREIEAIQREVGEGRIPAGEGRTIRLRRDYDAPIDDVWDALTNPERIGRWFLPISGDYRLGGRYQFEGNAGGEILACERPNRLKVTWVYGEPASDADISEVEVRLSTVDGGGDPARLRAHGGRPGRDVGPVRPGRGRRGLGRGLLGLPLHLRGGSIGDSEAWQVSAEGREFSTRSSEAWGEANRAAGADPETVAQGVANTTAFYAPEPDATS